MIVPPFLADEELAHRFQCSPLVLLSCAPRGEVSKARAPWLDWILLLYLPLGEGQGVVVLLEGWYCGLLGPVALPAGVAYVW